MNKPSPGPLADLVPKRPEVSALQNRTEQDRTRENPQTPASGGLQKLNGTSLSEARAQRARQGSKRKRDLEALAAISRVEIPADTKQSVEAEQAFGAAVNRLSFHNPSRIGATDGMLVCHGLSGNKVVVVAERMGEFWRKRYGQSLADAIRQVSDFDGCLICDEVRS